MTTPAATGGPSAVPQPAAAALTAAAIFLVVTVDPATGGRDRGAVALRRPRHAGARGRVSRPRRPAVLRRWRSGSEVWDRLFGEPRPAELHPFREFRAGARHAVATPGDILFHIRAQRMDLCFELASADHGAARRRRLRSRTRCTASAISISATCWVLSTAPRTPRVRPRSTPCWSATRTPAFAGGSYVIVQKYLHDLDGLERAADRGAGTHHRPHQTVQYRARRRGQAELRRTTR